MSSRNVPTFVNLWFYKNTVSPPPKNQNVPGDKLFEVNNATIESFEVVGYEPMHQFYVRNIKLKLAEPIILEGDMSDARIWMGVKSDADAWANTAHYTTGEGVVGESFAKGSDRFGWSQMLNTEGLYELDAECSFLGTSETATPLKVDIYPNPAQDYFEYTNLNAMSIVSVDVFDASGSLVKQYNDKQTRFDVSKLKKGFYIVKAKTSSNIVLTNKLIIK